MRQGMQRPKSLVNFTGGVSKLLPGVLICAILAMAAGFMSNHFSGPVMLFALLLGMPFNFLFQEKKFPKGIDFCATHILRCGVAFLGLKVTLMDFAEVGAPVAIGIVSGIVLTIALGGVLARTTSLKGPFGILSGGAVAICGASAALAISSVLPRDRHLNSYTILTVVGVTTLSTIAMVIYPLISAWFGFTEQEAGIFLGSTIHDVSQVIGAGYMVSDEAGKTAVIVKLIRITFLVPVVITLSFANRKAKGDRRSIRTVLPNFLLAFVAIALFNSAGVIPPVLISYGSDLARIFLVIAVTAVGIKTSLRDIYKIGPAALTILLLETAFLTGFAIFLLLRVY